MILKILIQQTAGGKHHTPTREGGEGIPPPPKPRTKEIQRGSLSIKGSAEL